MQLVAYVAELGLLVGSCQERRQHVPEVRNKVLSENLADARPAEKRDKCEGGLGMTSSHGKHRKGQTRQKNSKKRDKQNKTLKADLLIM